MANLPPQSNMLMTPPHHRPWYATMSGIVLLSLGVIVVGLLVVLAGLVVRYVQNIDTSQITLLPPTTNRLTEPLANGETHVTSDDPSAGSSSAKVQIVEFGDFQCPFCRESSGIVRRIIADYGDRIHFVFRDFPVTEKHPDAAKAAEAGECAQEQSADKFWALHDKFYQNQNKLGVSQLKSYAVQVGLDAAAFNACLDSGKFATEVAEDFQAGIDANVGGTPTFFINGYQLSGVVSEEVFRHAIDLVLAQ